MRRLFLGAAFTMLLFPVVAVAQTYEAVRTIRGQVCDVASGEPMIGVKITVENGTSIVAVSVVACRSRKMFSAPMPAVVRTKSIA